MSMESWLQRQEREEHIKRDKQVKREAMYGAPDVMRCFGSMSAAAIEYRGCGRCRDYSECTEMTEIVNENKKVEDQIKNKIDDAVNSPHHYQSDGIECIDAIRAALGTDGFIAYCRGNAIKYAWRAGKKGPNAAEDMGKAAVYSKWAAEAAL